MTKKAVEIEQFNMLDLPEQLDFLQKDGVHIGKRLIKGRIALLYQFNTFYIEVLYEEYRRIVKSIVLTPDVNILQPYLSQIEIEDLNLIFE